MTVIFALLHPSQGHLWEILTHYLSISVCFEIHSWKRWQNLQLLLESVNQLCNSNFILGTKFLLSNQSIYKTPFNTIVLPKLALIVPDPHSASGRINHAEEKKGREGRVIGQQTTCLCPLCTALGLPCTGIFTSITPIPALLLPAFALKSQAGIWNQSQLSFSSYTLWSKWFITTSVFYWCLEVFSFVHSIAKHLESCCPQRTLKIKLYGDATGKSIGSGTDIWTERPENTYGAILKKAETQTWSPSSLLASGLLSITQGSKDFSTKTPSRIQTWTKKSSKWPQHYQGQCFLNFPGSRLHLPCPLLPKSEEDMLSEVSFISVLPRYPFLLFSSLSCPGDPSAWCALAARSACLGWRNASAGSQWRDDANNVSQGSSQQNLETSST